MTDLILFCKSYSGDFQRAKRLIKSIARFNVNGIPLYVSVPSQDQMLFSKLTDSHGTRIHLIADEHIALSDPRVNLSSYQNLNGQLSQQVIKSEFWRFYLREHPQIDELVYICIDSDSEFIRNFYRHDFLHPSGSPYTVMHENTDLLALAQQKGIAKIELNFRKDCAIMKAAFDRDGPDYAFSPTPVIWSSKVWQDLDAQYLQPRGMTLWDAIKEKPNELHWYGEALLHFHSVPLHPVGPLFRVYHYDWEYFSRIKSGENIDVLRKKFLGVLRQSSWDFEMDHGDQKERKPLLSRALRHLKRFLSQYR